MSANEQIASSRVPVTPDTHEALREFRSGLNVSFDEAITLLLQLSRLPGEDNFAAGKRLREQLPVAHPESEG